MADEVKAEEQEKTGSGGGGKLKKILVIAGAVILPVIAAAVVFMFVISPMLNKSNEDKEDEKKEIKIPITVVTVRFDSAFATVLKSDPELPASQLMFTVDLECLNTTTQNLVMAHRPRFTHMINSLHEFRTREELDDRLVKETIEKQILQKANAILRQLQEEPTDEIKVTAVFHVQWVVHDSM